MEYMEKNPASQAVLTTCEDYDPARVRAALQRVIAQCGGFDWVRPGMRIGIKLNLCGAYRPEKAATTHPVMAAELTRLLTEKGAHVVLGDSPGEPFAAPVMNRVYNLCGLKLCEEAGGELNRDWSHHPADCPNGVTLHQFELCSWLQGCDAIISFSKLKAHGLMGMTAAVKNIYGVIPGTVKSEYHFRYPEPLAFANIMVDLNEYLRPCLYLCDAVDGMEGNGPTQGTPRHLGLLLGGTNPYAIDRVCAEITGIREEELLYLTAAKNRGLLAPEDAKDCLAQAQPYKAQHFVRSGATSSWFAIDPDDKPVRRLMKKAIARFLRSRPQLGKGCVECGHCKSLCPAGAITIVKGKGAVIDRKKCVRCFCCQEFCPTGAMKVHRTFIARLLEK